MSPTKKSSSLSLVRVFAGIGALGALSLGTLFWSANLVIWNEGLRYVECQSGKRSDCQPSLVWDLNGWKIVTPK